MKHFLDDTDRMNDLNELLEHHRQFVLANMQEVDKDVENQKTRFQKFSCFIRYGHLLNSDGICRRCGKAFTAKTEPAKADKLKSYQGTASESTVNTTNK
jgi:hypothetical protein